MDLAKYAIAAITTLAPFMATAESNQANSTAEARLWAFSEDIALNIAGHSENISRIVSGPAKRSRQENTLPEKEIGPYLFVRNAVIVADSGHHTESVTFNLSGSCVPVASLRSRYPSLIVMDYARGDSEHATYTFGTRIGDAIIAYSFPAKDLNCMDRVKITPAAATKTQLRVN